MPYTPHALLTFGGTWSDQPSEIWACNVRLSADGGGGVTLDTAGLMNDIYAPLSTWYALPASRMSSDSKLMFLKVNMIGDDGKYVSRTATNRHDYVGTLGGATPAAPQFCSLAYSWSTANARGPAHHGRIYPPNAAFVIVNGSKISAADATINTAAAKALLTVFRNVGGADGRRGTPVVASNIGGAIQPITGVSTDDLYDVQRRRKNRIVPTRSAILAFP
jgi:hypothetical protein